MSIGDIVQEIGQNSSLYLAFAAPFGYTIASTVSKYRTNKWLPWTPIAAVAVAFFGVAIINIHLYGLSSTEHNTNQFEMPVADKSDDKATSLYRGNEAHNDVYYFRD